MSESANSLVRFEGYEIDRANWQLRHCGELLLLHRKTFDLLLYLVDHAERVVSKDELLRALWPDSFVGESNLTQHVFLLRKTLSRHPSETRIIETVPGRGYRLAVPVEVDSNPSRRNPVNAAPLNTLDAAIQTRPENQEIGPDRDPTQKPGASRPTAVPEEFGPRHSLHRSRNSLVIQWAFLPAVVTGVLLALLYVVRSKPPDRQRVSRYTQITHDGHAKWLGGTDGSRIYFTQIDKDEIAQISISGGVEAPLPLAIKAPRSGQVSPDGSTLLILSQANGQGPATSLWSVHLIGGSYRYLGSAISAAWSPDGERLVCASAGGDLSVMRSDGSDKHQIASPGGFVTSMAWSPDGKTIRFTRDGFLWEISPEGGNLRQLLPGWGETPTQWSGQWSPDGRFFFVADGQIWVLEAEPLHQQTAPPPVQLTFGPMVWDRPLPSLDAKRLFASGRVRRGELVRFDPKSARLEPFLKGISAEFVAFSRSKQAVAYVSYPEGHLWRADVDGSKPIQLTGDSVSPRSICWSPDGSQIAFVNRTKDNVDAIFLIASDGTGKPHRLFPDDRQAETDPSWSSDGRRITFSTAPNVGGSAESDLRTFDLASGETAIVPASTGLLVPRWSPDGRALAAMTLDTAKLELFNLPSGKWVPLATGHVAFPEWSHDGRWIYYVGWHPDAALMRIRVADGKREVLATFGEVRYTGSYTLWMGLDPNNNPMMLRDEGTDDIYSLTLQDR